MKNREKAETITLSVAEQFDVELNRKRLNQFDSRKLKKIINSVVRFQVKKVIIKFIGMHLIYHVMEQKTSFSI